MSNVGKWGITRGAEGKLATLWEWPWYWRYPAGIAVLSIAGWMLYSNTGDGGNWRTLVVPGAAALVALSFMYELGCLVIVLVAGAALWLGISSLFPGVNSVPSPKTISVVALIAAGWAWVLANEARQESERNSRRIDALGRAFGEKAQSDLESRGYQYEEIYGIKARLEKLEGDDIDVDWRT